MSEAPPIDPAETRAEAKAWLARLHAPDAAARDWLTFEAWLHGAPERRAAYEQASAEWDNEDTSVDEAAEWLGRLHGDDVGAADWLAFETWLQGAPERRPAYDRALALWEELNARTPELKARLGFTARVTRIADRFATRRLVPFMAMGSAVAAAAAAVIFVALPAGFGPAAPKPVAYATAKGQRQTIALADGSRIDLNGGSRILVTYGPHARQVALQDGEAAFDVTHDAQRPFLIAAGDHTVRVVGTQFDVQHQDGRLTVLVRRGVVEIDNANQASQAAPAGMRFSGRDGVPEGVVEEADPQELSGWRAGRLIYRNRPFSEVVADLNRYFPETISVADAGAGALRFSGVLVVDKEDPLIRRIEALLPVSADRSNGAIVFRAERETR